MPAAIILRAAKMIKDSGAAAAIKKYGKEVVDEAKKHIKDIKTKKTVGQAQTEKATQGQRTYRSGQRKAGTAGAVGGYTAGSVDLSSKNGELPIADMSQGVDVRGTEEGIRYFQNGKEVRMPKKSYN
jgi:uncharacterized protein involved in outer membrane biogenesis